MNKLTKFLIGLFAIVLIAGIIGIALPRHVVVVRSLIMNAPAIVIYTEINNVHSWPRWSAWHRLDPKMEITYSGPESGAGAGYSWKSTNKNVGEGKLAITSAGPDSIATEMDFMKNGKASALFHFSTTGTKTTVTWTMNSDMGNNPIAKLFGFFMMDKMIGPDFEKGLHNLDSISQLDMKSKPADKIYEIQHTHVEAAKVMTVRRICPSADSIAAYIGSMFGEIGGAMGKQGLKQAGPVFAIYHVFSETKIDFEAGLTVDKMGKDDGNVKARELPATNALCIDYYGPYNTMRPAYNQLQSYIKTTKAEVTGPPWEVYVGDPGLEKDPSKLLTKIFYPVK
ncbi:MAG: GyrI-like domain-containing protein [Bacteroidia bacterium]